MLGKKYVLIEIDLYFCDDFIERFWRHRSIKFIIEWHSELCEQSSHDNNIGFKGMFLSEDIAVFVTSHFLC